MNTTQSIRVNDIVSFKPEFSDKLAGTKWVVATSNKNIEAATNKDMVSLKTKRNGRWCWRLANVADLIKVG